MSRRRQQKITLHDDWLLPGDIDRRDQERTREDEVLRARPICEVARPGCRVKATTVVGRESSCDFCAREAA